MKQIFLAYTLVSLLVLALLSVLSYGYGAGYVYAVSYTHLTLPTKRIV